MTQVRQLENCLEDEKMLERIRNYMKSSGHEVPEKNVDMSRREFLSRGAKLAGAAAVVSTGLGFSSNAEAIVRGSFPSIRKYGPAVYEQNRFLKGMYTNVNNRGRRERLGQLFDSKEDHKVWRNGSNQPTNLDPTIPYYQPFYSFFANTFRDNYNAPNNNPHSNYAKLNELNPALDAFDFCMSGFRCKWIDTDIIGSTDAEKIEENGLKSICIAAFGKQKGEQAAKGMLKSNINGKKIYAQKILESFSRMSGFDKTSTEPQNPFNQVLVANWAAYILSNHFEEKFHEMSPRGRRPYNFGTPFFEEVDFYNTYLVEPLEKLFISNNGYRVKPAKDERYHLMSPYYVMKSQQSGKPILVGDKKGFLP